jgi:hypothetical protein
MKRRFDPRWAAGHSTQHPPTPKNEPAAEPPPFLSSEERRVFEGQVRDLSNRLTTEDKALLKVILKKFARLLLYDKY